VDKWHPLSAFANARAPEAALETKKRTAKIVYSIFFLRNKL
jgi:hypothetical protein